MGASDDKQERVCKRKLAVTVLSNSERVDHDKASSCGFMSGRYGSMPTIWGTALSSRSLVASSSLNSSVECRRTCDWSSGRGGVKVVLSGIDEVDGRVEAEPWTRGESEKGVGGRLMGTCARDNDWFVGGVF